MRNVFVIMAVRQRRDERGKTGETEWKRRVCQTEKDREREKRGGIIYLFEKKGLSESPPKRCGCGRRPESQSRH